jgi:hypothetical protein
VPNKTLQPAVEGHELGHTIKTVRVTTGSVAASSQAPVVVTWPTPFPSTNYTVSAFVEETTVADNLRVLKIQAKSAADVTIRVQNVEATARTGTLNVVGIPD